MMVFLGLVLGVALSVAAFFILNAIATPGREKCGDSFCSGRADPRCSGGQCSWHCRFNCSPRCSEVHAQKAETVERAKQLEGELKDLFR